MKHIEIIDLNFQGVPESIAAFLIRGQEGSILVESGPHSTLPVLEAKLNSFGVALKDIKHILLTHIHLDHAGAAWAIAREAGASVFVHPRGKAHLLDPSRLMASAKRIYGDQMDSLWGDLQPIPAAQLKTINHGERLQLEGLTFTAWHTPGHASHHIAWQLENVVFTGDVAGARIGQGVIVPPCPPPDINIREWKDSIRLLSRLDVDKLYLTHFGVFQDISNHLSILEKTLDAWVDWIKPYILNDSSPETILQDFKLYVEKSYEDKKMGPEMKDKYAKANPLDMNVSGLMRYWQKFGDQH